VLAGVLLGVSACGSDVPDLDFPQTWTVTQPGQRPALETASSITVDEDGTGALERVPLLTEGECWEEKKGFVSAPMAWELDGAIVRVDAGEVSLDLEVDGQGLGSLNRERMSVNLCPGADGRADFVRYETML
jgi:hypothetical protein